MKGVVERYGDKELKQQYKQSAHGALCDAKAFGKISKSSLINIIKVGRLKDFVFSNVGRLKDFVS